MKYLKLFETKTEELENFCKNNLAYLIDDGFNFSIKVSRMAQIQSDKYFNLLVKFIQDTKYDTIVIEKKSFGLNTFNFYDYSDDIITFILFIKEKYKFKSIMYINDRGKVINVKSDNDVEKMENSKIKRLIITINK